MAVGAELERLIIRLVGDGREYENMLKRAEQQTKTYVGKTGRLHDKATGRFVKNINKMRLSLKTLGRAMIMAGDKMRAAGRTMSLAVTAPLTILGGLAVRQFSKFDNAMTQSLAIMEATTGQMEQMRQTVIELSFSGDALQGPTQLGEAYFFLASAGKDAEQSMSLLPQVAKFATAGMFDMALATDLLTDAQSALGLSVKDVAQDSRNMARVSDVLVKANTLANASVEQFSVALTSKAGAALKSFNKDVEEGVAVLAAMADQGIKAQLAGNSLGRTIRLLSKASMDNAKAHKELGFRVFDSAGKMRNLGDIIGNLEDVLRGMSDQTKVATLDMLGFEARVQQVILPLIGTSDAIKKYEEQLRRAKGITDEVARKQMKSFSGQMKILWNQIKIVGIEIGQILAPWLIKIGHLVKGAIDTWRGWSKTTKTVTVAIAAQVAVLGPFLIVVGLLISTLGQVIIVLNAVAASASLTSAALLGIAGVAVIAAIGAVKFALAGVNAELKEAQGRVDALGESRLLSIAGLEGTGQTVARSIERNRRLHDARQARENLQKAESVLAERMKKGAGGATLVEWLVPTIAPLKEAVELAEKAVEVMGDWQKTLNPLEETTSFLEPIRDFLRRQADKTGEKRGASFFGIDAAQRQFGQLFDLVKGKSSEAFDFVAKRAEEGWEKAAKAGIKSMQTYKKQIEEGMRITEQFLTPVEKFVKKQQELQAMFGRGDIDFTTFGRAMEAAKNELDEIRAKSDVTVRFNVAGIQAVRRGSAEATARLLAFRHMQSMTARPGVSRPELDAAKKRVAATAGKDSPQMKVVANLERLIEIAEESLEEQKKEETKFAEAGFN